MKMDAHGRWGTIGPRRTNGRRRTIGIPGSDWRKTSWRVLAGVLMALVVTGTPAPIQGQPTGDRAGGSPAAVQPPGTSDRPQSYRVRCVTQNGEVFYDVEFVGQVRLRQGAIIFQVSRNTLTFDDKAGDYFQLTRPTIVTGDCIAEPIPASSDLVLRYRLDPLEPRTGPSEPHGSQNCESKDPEAEESEEAPEPNVENGERQDGGQ